MLLGQFMIFFQRLRIFLVQIDDVIRSLLLVIDICSLMELRSEEVHFRFSRFVLLSITLISGQTVGSIGGQNRISALRGNVIVIY